MAAEIGTQPSTSEARLIELWDLIDRCRRQNGEAVAVAVAQAAYHAGAERAEQLRETHAEKRPPGRPKQRI